MAVMAAVKAAACYAPSTNNWYLFSVVPTGNFSFHIQSQFLDNWIAYVGSDTDFYWYDADKVRAAARRKGDTLMLSYVDQLDRYLDIARDVETESWDYPTKEELRQQRQTLESIRDYAASQLGSRLRSQHALLLMRCNMLLGRHEENTDFWEHTASAYINSAYRDMMRNIYAGALLKTGRTDEATLIFIEQEDLASLYTYYYDKRSVDDIRRLYEQNPDSPAMPFLLQDFANNAQEAIDGLDEYSNMPGKLFISNIAREESEQMCSLARQVVDDGHTSEPALWKSLEAWLQYLGGDRQQAAKTIAKAMKLKGSPRTMANARVLRLYITADQADDDFIAEELAWLERQANETRNSTDFYDNHYTQVYDRLVHQVLVDRYTRDQRPELGMALMAAKEEMALRFYKQRTVNDDYDDYNWNSDYTTDFFVLIDSVPVTAAERYLQFVATPAKQTSALGKWLTAHIPHDTEFLHELIGTKHLRERQWQKAIDYLSQVTEGFINQMNIAPFMAQRDYSVEPWMRRQWIKETLLLSGATHAQTEAGTTRLTAGNQKLQFAREMMQMENNYQQAKGTERQRLAYDLAVRYYQASLWGDAWYLTAYGKSTTCYPEDPRPDFVVKAGQLLDEAAKATDYALREHAVFARAFAPFDAWHTFEWDADASSMVALPIKNRPEYAAMKRLADFATANKDQLSTYVTRCDVLKQFLKTL